MNKGNFTDFLALVFMKLWEDQKIHHKTLFIILTHFMQKFYISTHNFKIANKQSNFK